jgi:hypothetical protein
MDMEEPGNLADLSESGFIHLWRATRSVAWKREFRNIVDSRELAYLEESATSASGYR